MTVAARLVATFAAGGLRLVTVESCTGGLVAGAVTDIPGASAVLERGFITYSNAAKTELVAVPAGLIAAHGAVSEPVAEAMARGGLAASHADIAVAVTGVAGPGGSEHKPEGRVCFAVADRAGAVVETRDFGPQGRETVRRLSVAHALEMALEMAVGRAERS